MEKNSAFNQITTKKGTKNEKNEEKKQNTIEKGKYFDNSDYNMEHKILNSAEVNAEPINFTNYTDGQLTPNFTLYAVDDIFNVCRFFIIFSLSVLVLLLFAWITDCFRSFQLIRYLVVLTPFDVFECTLDCDAAVFGCFFLVSRNQKTQ